MNTLLMSPFTVRVNRRNLNDLNQFVDRFITDQAIPRVKTITNKLASAPVNILKTESTYELHLAVPGYSKDQITLNVEENVLTIEANANVTKGTDIKYNHQEFSLNGFKRSFILPENAELNSIKANSNNGILTIVIDQKVEEAKKSLKINID